jgi:nucleoside transporter
MSLRAKLFVMMVLEVFVWGAWQPKIFSYMNLLGFTPGQQSLVGSVFGIAAVLGIFFSNQFADRNFASQRFLAVSHAVGGLALLGAAFQTEFWPFFGLFLVYGIFYVPTLSVTHSLAFAHLADPAREFGAVRMGGTVGWIAASWPFVFLLAGKEDAALVDATKWIFLVAALASFAMAAFSLTLPHTPPRRDAAGLDRLAWMRAARLLGTPFVLVLFLVTFVDSFVHNGYFVLSDDFLTSRVGIGANMSMVVMSIGQVAEIVAMVVLGRVLARLGWKWTMLLGIFGHLARFGVFALFPDAQGLIVGIQLLHGICYAFFFATVYIFVDEVFPKDVRSSAQGLFNLLIVGVGMVLAGSIFPELKARYTEAGVTDWRGLFLVPTGLAAAAVVLMAVCFHPPSARPASASSTP